MAEWQEVAQGEVHKIRKIIGAGLDFCSKQKPRDHGLFQTGQIQRLNPPRPVSNNNGNIPMKVDATLTRTVKKQPSQDVLHGDEAEKELSLARLVSSYTLPHQNSQPGERGQQTARSKVLSRRARDT